MTEITRRCGNCVSFEPSGEPAYCTNLVTFATGGVARPQVADDKGCPDHCTHQEDRALDRDHAAARKFIVELFGQSSLSA